MASDALAASALSRYLEERGVPATVELLATRDTAVFVGPGTSAQLAELIANANFDFRPGTSLLYNRNPLEGEPASFPFTRHSPVHETGHEAFARRAIIRLWSPCSPPLRSLIRWPNSNGKTGLPRWLRS